MTVPATSRRAGPFTGNGFATVFPFSFRVFSESDVSATLLVAGVETPLALDTHFSVAVHADQDVTPGGTVTYPLIGAPMGPDATLFVVGALPYDQTADLPAGGSFSPQALENALDRGVMQAQQLAEQLSRALQFPVSASGPFVLPGLLQMEGKLFAVVGGQVVGIAPSSGSATDLALVLAQSGVGQGARLVGAKVDGGTTSRTVHAKLSELPSVIDAGAVGDGTANDTAAVTAAIAAWKTAFFPPGYNHRADLGNGLGSVQTWHFHSGEASPNQGTLGVTRYTTTSKDAIKAEHYGTGTGYAVHAISYATTGSGVGGACWGVGAGVVGNKRGTGTGAVGNGVAGTAGIDNGNDQTGVSGTYGGTGSGGTGVSATNTSTHAAGGNALFAWRSGTGGGAAAQLLRDGGGDGQALTATRSGTGAGDAAVLECSTSGAGQALAAVRKVGATTYALGYVGYYNVATGEAVGVYGSTFAGTTRWAGRFDGATKTTGYAEIGGGARPDVDGGANMGTASKRWDTYYGVVGAINTSDRSTKQDIRALSAAESRAAAKIKQTIKAFRYRSSVAAKSDASRVHIGWIAQDVAAAMRAEGLDPSRYGMWCEDELEDGSKRQGLRMDQVLAFVLAAA